jgi:HK97 family phage major capsid protein
VVPDKVAGLTVISRELALDTTPAATEVVGQALARDIAKRVDQAFFGTTTVNGPAGLGSLTGAQTVVAGPVVDLDPFAEAISLAENVGAITTAFVASPETVLALSQLKKAAGSNEPLLSPQADPTVPTTRQILCVPVWSSPAVSPDDVWGLPQAFSFVVQNDQPTLDVDGSAYFSSDRIGIRSTLRVVFGWPHPAAIIRVDVSEGS